MRLSLVDQLGSLDEAWATLIAGTFALMAGTLAYRGAIMSLRFQRRQVEQEAITRSRNLYLKAEHMAFNLAEVSSLRMFAAQIEFPRLVDGIPVAGTIPRAILAVTRPAQLDELWNNLSSLPPEAIYQIRAITRNFDAAEGYLSRVKEVPHGGDSPLAGYYQAIADAAFLLKDIMGRLTSGFSRDVEDRGERLYGLPDDCP